MVSGYTETELPAQYHTAQLYTAVADCPGEVPVVIASQQVTPEWNRCSIKTSFSACCTFFLQQEQKGQLDFL